MNEPKEAIDVTANRSAGHPPGTPPSGGEVDRTMGGTDNTTDYRDEQQRQAAPTEAPTTDPAPLQAEREEMQRRLDRSGRG